MTIVCLVKVETNEIRDTVHGDWFVSRCRTLGLSAYGPTATISRMHFWSLFKQFCKDVYEMGQLAIQLDRSGINWYEKSSYEEKGNPTLIGYTVVQVDLPDDQ